MHFFDGIKLVERAIKPIKAGDPVEITYIDGTWMPFNFRQRLIDEHWGFYCLCSVCK